MEFSSLIVNRLLHTAPQVCYAVFLTQSYQKLSAIEGTKLFSYWETTSPLLSFFENRGTRTSSHLLLCFSTSEHPTTTKTQICKGKSRRERKWVKECCVVVFLFLFPSCDATTATLPVNMQPTRQRGNAFKSLMRGSEMRF